MTEEEAKTVLSILVGAYVREGDTDKLIDALLLLLKTSGATIDLQDILQRLRALETKSIWSSPSSPFTPYVPFDEHRITFKAAEGPTAGSDILIDFPSTADSSKVSP